MSEVNVKLRNQCEVALESMKKLNDPDTTELQSKLEWCLGSYDYDNNPSGLYEFGSVTLQTLKDIKKANPRKINKKVIEGLEKSIAQFEISAN
jgi:hypothetical protein